METLVRGDVVQRCALQAGVDLENAVAGVPGISVYVQNPPAISIGGLQSKSLYQFTMQSGNINVLNASARQLENKLKQLPSLVGVTSDLLIENPQVTTAR